MEIVSGTLKRFVVEIPVVNSYVVYEVMAVTEAEAKERVRQNAPRGLELTENSALLVHLEAGRWAEVDQWVVSEREPEE